MKKLFAIIGGIVFFVGALAGVAIYLKKKGIIDFKCPCKCEDDDFDICCCGDDAEASPEAATPAEE